LPVTVLEVRQHLHLQESLDCEFYLYVYRNWLGFCRKNLFLPDMRFKLEKTKITVWRYLFSWYIGISFIHKHYNSYVLISKIMCINSNKNCISETKIRL